MTCVLLDHGHVTTPSGWRAGVAACGIKYTGRTDLALLVSERPCRAAALFTTNRVVSAHIHYDRAVLARNSTSIRAVLINAGSANACTGEVGIAAAEATAREVERTLALPTDSTLVMSTGVIGLLLPVDRVVQGIATASQHLDAAHGPDAARAIMTTDTRPKQCAVRVALPDGEHIHIGGMVKGAGMVHPNMATMLSVVTTDAAVEPAALDAALRFAADRSFNCISIDGDTSTNDTLLALANGRAGNPLIAHIESAEGQAFLAGLVEVCQRLAQEVVRDGEGATRLVTLTVRGAVSDEDAHRAAMAVARSPLVKTAIFGGDPNWGRVVCALGYSGATIDPDRVVLHFGPVPVFAHGVPQPFDELAAHQVLSAPDVLMVADLGMGTGTATVWTCDFSYEYVRINAEYRT
ncbi:MAG: bifunctional glutamate N-acetyltransferase/amino-acid acetyltransferase ArgJ [Chloroflexaceae bacterium]|nr:bifunctional glutamate N-acetyltransferase/amino-acid acetyltransferase ArgJ [Chloroflexaceae bacterium]